MPTEALLTSVASKINEGKGNAVTSAEIDLLREKFASSEVPYLNRNYLRREAGAGIVRVIGLVQDQLDPEYYQTTIGGRSTKYRDYVYNADDGNGENEGACDDPFDPVGAAELAERQPLVVVPLPFTSQWFRDVLVPPTTSKVVNGSATKAGSSSKPMDLSSNKRSRDEDSNCESDDAQTMQVECAAEDDVNPARKIRQTEDDAMKSPTTVASTNNDWWPAGTMGSDTKGVPVLAKVYYDDEGNENPDDADHLRLNDIVELIGIVHFDPVEASFANQQPKERGDGAAKCIGSSYGEDALDEFDHLSILDECALPPPSILPRLHVLAYRRVDLYKTNHITTASSPCIDDSASILDDREYAISMLSEQLGGNAVAGQALLMALMSMAERKTASALSAALKTPFGSTLGSASLKINCATAEECLLLKKRLETTLRQIIPVVASADLTLDSLRGGAANASSSTVITSPTKAGEGRLTASVMQLPRGSCLLINEGSLAEGVIDEHGSRSLAALTELTQNHTVPYCFNGCTLNFEGDVIAIVLSSSDDGNTNNTRPNSGTTRSRGEKILGCTMQVSCKDIDLDNINHLSKESAERIRAYISRCRTGGGGIILSKDILSRAEKDFVGRRVQSRETAQGREVAESDFHRWLTLTRLMSRSKNVSKASISDWVDALSLDDGMMAS